jgi:hypothetical protein
MVRVVSGPRLGFPLPHPRPGVGQHLPERKLDPVVSPEVDGVGEDLVNELRGSGVETEQVGRATAVRGMHMWVPWIPVVISRVTPQRAVEFMLQQKGMSRSDLNELMGGKSRVSEFLSGRRDLSKAQIEALHRHLGIPAEVLLGL